MVNFFPLLRASFDVIFPAKSRYSGRLKLSQQQREETTTWNHKRQQRLHSWLHFDKIYEPLVILIGTHNILPRVINLQGSVAVEHVIIYSYALYQDDDTQWTTEFEHGACISLCTSRIVMCLNIQVDLSARYSCRRSTYRLMALGIFSSLIPSGNLQFIRRRSRMTHLQDFVRATSILQMSNDGGCEHVVIWFFFQDQKEINRKREKGKWGKIIRVFFSASQRDKLWCHGEKWDTCSLLCWVYMTGMRMKKRKK